MMSQGQKTEINTMIRMYLSKQKIFKAIWKHSHSHALCGTILLLIVLVTRYWYMGSNEEFHDVKSGSLYNGSDHCQGKQIYMYNLPEKFNTLLLGNCSGQIVPWLNFCPHAQNDGFGLPIANHSGWYASDLYMVELVFHRRMMEYPCLVDSMDSADAFYVPYYSGLDALRFLYGSEKSQAGEHGSNLASWLEESGGPRWRRKGGADHFMVTGRTVWDLCAMSTPGWGTGLLEQRALENVTVLCVEGRTWVEREQAVPYLTSFHPDSTDALGVWTSRVESAERRFLFAFVGGERKKVGLRQAVIWQCRNSSRCDFLNCGEMKCSHRPVAVMEKLLTAEFCLQPPGDSPTRRSTFDGLIAGCVPVFFRNDSAYQQYTWHLPADTDSYSVFLPEEKVVSGELRIEDVLGSYSAERKRRMREKIVEIIPQIIYMKNGGFSGSVKDAFDMSLEGVFRRAGQASLTSKSVDDPSTDSLTPFYISLTSQEFSTGPSTFTRDSELRHDTSFVAAMAISEPLTEGLITSDHPRSFEVDVQSDYLKLWLEKILNKRTSKRVRKTPSSPLSPSTQ